MSNEKTFTDGIQLTTGKTVVNRNHPASHHQERRLMAQAGRKTTRTFDRGNMQNQGKRKTYGRRPNWANDGNDSICCRHGGHYDQIAMTIHKDEIIDTPVIIDTCKKIDHKKTVCISQMHVTQDEVSKDVE
jgi:hypothetical protein